MPSTTRHTGPHPGCDIADLHEHPFAPAPDPNIAIAQRWITPDLRQFLEAEVSNEKNGGVAPATLESAIDSLLQGLEVYDFDEHDYVALLAVVGAVGTDTEVRDLL